jgi:hypothetical protein
MRVSTLASVALALTSIALSACGDDDDDGSDAQRRDVGASCAIDEDCTEEGQTCLDFKGGYCGIAACRSDADCPDGSACVTHEDGQNYCFLICLDKSQCNQDRPPEHEANCSANITFTDADRTEKACVPPSG